MSASRHALHSALGHTLCRGGAHLRTPRVIKRAKRPDDRANYYLQSMNEMKLVLGYAKCQKF